MYGAQQFTLTPKDWVKGIRSSEFAEDGVLGTESAQLNPFAQIGLLQSTATAVDKSTNLTENLIASCEDNQYLGDYRVFIGASGNIYHSGSSGTLTKYSMSATRTYTFGYTDMVPYAGSIYISSTAYLAQYNSSAHTWSESYKTFANSYHHPLIVFDQLLFIGDGNLLKSMDSSGTVTTIITFPTGEEIVALGIDQGSGLLLVSTQPIIDPSNTYPQKGVVYMCDSYSSKPRRKVIVDAMVTAFYSVGGTLFIGMANILGTWNGSGVTFLRKLGNVTNTQNILLYKHKFAHIGSVLFALNGSTILAYGEAQKDVKGFFNFHTTYSYASPNIAILAPIGGSLLGVASSTNTFATIDMASSAAGAGTARIGWVDFARPVQIRKIRVFTNAISSTSGSGIGSFYWQDDNRNIISTAVLTFVNTSATARYYFDFDYPQAKTMSAKFLLTFDGSTQFAVQKIVGFYDFVE